MSLSLNPILLNAQDSLERHPIVELVSTQPTASIPFDGEYINSSDIPEDRPELIAHSSGRMVSVFIRNDDDVIMLYTDVDRLQWIENHIFSSVHASIYSIKSISLCELPNKDIGIVYVEKGPINYYLKYIVFRIDSDTSVSIVVASTVIESYLITAEEIRSPFVYRLQNNSFLLVYSYFDGTDYFIYERASTDFLTWGSSSVVSLSGFVTVQDTNNPSLIQVASGDILLFLDHVTDISGTSIVTNIFKVISDDGGITWGIPEQLTSYTAWGSGGIRPYPSLTDGNAIKLSFHETNDVLFINYDSDLWQNDCADPTYSAGTSIHYDPVTKKLYVKQYNATAGSKSLCGVVVIDTESWTVERNYNTGTVPKYSQLFLDTHVWYGAQKHHSEGKYVSVSTMDHLNSAVMVINDETETITTYVFKSNDVYDDIVENMVWDPPSGEGAWEGMWKKGCRIFGTWVDEDSDRVYIGMAYQYLYLPYIQVGYIDLTEVKNPITGKYTFREIAWIENWVETEITALFNSSGGLLIIKELSRFCLYGNTDIDYWRAVFGVYDLNSGAKIFEKRQDTSPSFPFRGMGYCTYYNNHVYGMIQYNTTHDQETYRGLCDIDFSTGLIHYHRPTYADIDQYNLFDGAVMSDDRIALAAYGYGVAVYDVNADTWLLYNNDNVSGFEPIGTPNCMSVAYNDLEDAIYTGSVSTGGSSGYAGVRAISEEGSFNQGKYQIGTLADVWEFTESFDLSQGLADFDFSVAIDEDGVLWSVWIRRDLSLYSIKWDKDQPDFDLTDYLIGSVGVSWDIANVSNLSFKLSHGHLFDPNNSLSVLNIYSKKGRGIKVRFGEVVGGIKYWQNQGTFYIQSRRISYGRGRYPSMAVTCEDKVAFLEDVQVPVSSYYSEHKPEEILKDLIILYSDILYADILIEDFDTTHVIWYQAIDETLMSIVKLILDHYGYFSCMSVDSKFTSRKVRTAVDYVDHEYLDSSKALVNFTPNDNHSNFINRVTVKGELRDPLEVIYAEELLTAIAGSGGWWGPEKIVKKVYFSDDKKKKCRNVRLVTVQSIKDSRILLSESGGTEYVSFYDPKELYIEITIEFPDLQSALIGLMASIVALGALAVSCDSTSAFAKLTFGLMGGGCGYYIMLFSLLTSATGYILGQVATYDYEIYGSPVGEVKQTVQGTANDEELQSYLRLVMSSELFDEFCYSMNCCRAVAEYELDIVKAQRNKVSLSKIAHLQDEIGDIIQVNHPYSQEELKIFITSLRRVLEIGSSGKFIDTIEGWNL